jgi:amidase
MDLWKHSAGELARKIAQREVSSKEVVEAHLARIDDVNPKLNAVVHVMRKDALSAAEDADKAVKSGEALGPLHGIPVTIKCNIDMKGLASTWGIPAQEHTIVNQDAPLVENAKRAGAIPIARTNCPDLGMRVHTDSSLYGLTRNPWDFERTTAGSSGGEASALASGMSPLGFGNDIGGSLRNPANACGIASIRPSAGRVPDASEPPFDNRTLAWQFMAVHGPMARKVSDVRLGLKAILGPHPRDPLALPAPFDGASEKIRIAVVANPPGGSCASSISEAVNKAAAVLSKSGYEVEQATPPSYEEVFSVWGQFLMGDYAPLWDGMAALMGKDGRHFFGHLFSLYPKLQTSADLSALMVARDRLAREWSVFMANYQIVLSPTWTQLPFVHGFDVQSPDAIAKTMEMMRPVMPANLLGLPCACVPVTIDPETGLPIGVLLTGRRFRDDQCLDVAEDIERGSSVATPINPKW